MQTQKVVMKDNAKLSRELKVIINAFPEEENAQSALTEICVSVFDHILTQEEVDEKLEGFNDSPSEEMKKQFLANRKKSLSFISEYLKSHNFFNVDVNTFSKSNWQYRQTFRFSTCSADYDFYEVAIGELKKVIFFIPDLKIYIEMNDDYNIFFYIKNASQSTKDEIINLAKSKSLYVLQDNVL